MSLLSNGVDLVRSLPKIPMRVRGTNFCINCTQTLQNTTIHEFSAQWGGSGAFIAKNYDAISSHELLH